MSTVAGVGKRHPGVDMFVVVSECFPKGLQAGSVIAALDLFYDDPANRNIKLPNAIKILAMKVNGKPAADVNTMIRAARETSSR